jgi:hypothetical protein
MASGLAVCGALPAQINECGSEASVVIGLRLVSGPESLREIRVGAPSPDDVEGREDLESPGCLNGVLRGAGLFRRRCGQSCDIGVVPDNRECAGRHGTSR